MATRAQQHQLGPLVHEPVEVFLDQVNPLLVVQAPDEAQQGHVWPLRQAQLLLQQQLCSASQLELKFVA